MALFILVCCSAADASTEWDFWGARSGHVVRYQQSDRDSVVVVVKDLREFKGRLWIDRDPVTQTLLVTGKRGDYAVLDSAGTGISRIRLQRPEIPRESRRNLPQKIIRPFHSDYSPIGNNLWVTADTGLYRFDGAGTFAQRIELNLRPVAMDASEQTGDVIVATRNKFFIFDRYGDEVSSNQFFSRVRITQLVAADSEGRSWVLARKGSEYHLVQVDRGGNLLSQPDLMRRVRNIAGDNNGGIWMITRSTLIHFSNTGEQTEALALPGNVSPQTVHVEISPDRISLIRGRKLIWFDKQSRQFSETRLPHRLRSLAPASTELIDAIPVTIVSPTKNSVVSARPNLSIEVGETGQAVLPQNFSLMADQIPISTDCVADQPHRWRCQLKQGLNNPYPTIQMTIEWNGATIAKSAAVELKLDRDGDGVIDALDLYPDDPSEASDLDGDGIGDNADTDRDGDAVENTLDEYPDDGQFSADNPELTVYSAAQIVVPGTIFRFNGIATDAGSGIDRLYATNQRYPGIEFALVPGTDSLFTGELPLLPGVNSTLITAQDRFGNRSTKAVEVTSIDVPELTLEYPSHESQAVKPSIAIGGRVFSWEQADSIRVAVGSHQQIVEPTETPNYYRFHVPDYPLVPGDNKIPISVSSVGGETSEQIRVLYLPDGVEDVTAPVITIDSPRVTGLPGGLITNRNSIEISGVAEDDSGIAEVLLNQSRLTTTGTEISRRRFSQSLDLTGMHGPVEFTITAQDVFGNLSDRQVRLQLDREMPQVVIHSPSLLEAPHINAFNANPISLSGELVDDSLAGVTLNDQPLAVIPTADSNRFRFSVALDIAAGDPAKAQLKAWDRAGNQTVRQYQLNYQPVVTAEIVTPLEGEQIVVQDATSVLSVSVRLVGDSEDVDRVFVGLVGGPGSDLPVTGNIGSVELQPGLLFGEHQLIVRVFDRHGDIISTTQRIVNIVDGQNQLPSLLSSIPENGAQGIDPNTFIRFDFDLPIELEKLAFEVTETVYSQVYAETDNSLVGSATPPGQLADLVRQQEPVAGRISILPGDKTVAFYPARDYGYTGTVFVTVLYDGHELARSQFTVRSRPTFIQGVVSDQFLQPLADIKVTLPELELTAFTDANGSFAFGFGLPSDKTIPAGRHWLYVNPDMEQSRYGSTMRQVTTAEGRLNRAGMFRIPQLNPVEPFRRISSGMTAASFSAGELMLDLSETVVEFPDLSDQGDVHVQFMGFSELGVTGIPALMPHWVYSVQPAGIKLSGSVGVSIKSPPLYGDTDYLPEDGTPVVLLGLDPDAGRLMPVGVGRLSGDRVSGKGQFKVLDFISFALVPPALYPELEALESMAISIEEFIGQIVSRR